MRKVIVVVFIGLVCALTFLPPTSAAPKAPPLRGNFVPDEVLVEFKPGVQPEVAARAVGALVHDRIAALNVHVLKVPSGSVEGTIRALERNPLVEFAEPNGYLHAFLYPNDPYANATCYTTSSGQCVTQWAWGNVNAASGWNVTTGSSSVRVAVVDTGIDVGDPTGNPPDTGHPDIVGCQSVIITSFVSGETGNDDNGHGTHVAGTIGACTNNGTGVAGANWSVQLMGVKVLDFSGSGTYSAVAQGITWAANNGANVINLSLGGGPSRTVQKAVNYAWNKGAVLACAAGNNGSSSPTYPAAYSNCMAVAATDQNSKLASFSSFGSWVDVAAPGVGILSTIQDNFYWCFLCYWYGYLPGYDALSGTSMATPHVAGLAALIWASGKCSTNSCVRTRIENNTSMPIPGTAHGLVDYGKALTAP